MSVCESANVDIKSDGVIATGETTAILETDLSSFNPQTNSTANAFAIDSGYVTKKGEAPNLPRIGQVDFLDKFRNGQVLGNGTRPWSKIPTRMVRLVSPLASVGEENAS